MEGCFTDERDPPNIFGVIPCLAGTQSHTEKNTTGAFSLMISGKPGKHKLTPELPNLCVKRPSTSGVKIYLSYKGADIFLEYISFFYVCQRFVSPF